MNLFTVEYGTFWVWEAENGLPPPVRPRANAIFEEILPGDLSGLANVMDSRSLENARRRLEGRRRCFALQLGGNIISYGWVTFGRESVGELEREFNLAPDEAYIWDCATVPGWRRKGCYSALLSLIIMQLYGEGTPRAWIGASRQNKPSVHGIAKAGFEQVLELTYRRFWVLVVISLREAPYATGRLVSMAADILLNAHEKRIGRFAFGLKT